MENQTLEENNYECCEMCGVPCEEEMRRIWFDYNDTEILYCDECYDRMIERKKEELIEQTCPHCKRNEEECEKNAEGERNPITEWCGWGLSCDDCYYKNHPESDDEEDTPYMLELIECRECKKETKRKDLKWNEGSYTDICLVCTKKYKIENGCINFNFYKTYLSNHMPSNKMNQKIIKWFEENEDELLEYKAFTITRKDENNVSYSECILLDFDDKFIPIIMTGINTSSSYAMSRCGMGREEDEDEIEETMTLNEIDEMLNIKSDFKTVINNLEN
jgi:hypothetical protein